MKSNSLCKPCIDIVLATFNGQNFLKQQIESIQKNTNYHYINRLIVTDDGSTDHTRKLIENLASEDEKIEFHYNPKSEIGTSKSLTDRSYSESRKNVYRRPSGPVDNFSYGLSLSTSQYIMLCDQDDIWLPNKIELSYKQICLLESRNSRETTPALVFTDMIIVDDQLNTIERSYYDLKQIPKDWHRDISNLAQQNVASGCTMIFNRQLLDCACPIPGDVYMHDWWLVLIAKYYGKIYLLDIPLILYRQHQNNTLGANKRSIYSSLTQFRKLYSQFESNYWKTVTQADLLIKHTEKYQPIKSSQSKRSERSIPKSLLVLSNSAHASRWSLLQSWFAGLLTRSHLLGKTILLIVLMVKNH